MTSYIYSLSDPRTRGIRYIGKTNNLATRRSHHCSSYHNRANTHKCNWVRSLLTKGLLPTLDVVDEVDRYRSDFWEQHYISLYRSWGFRLTNLTSGGEGCFEHSIETKRLLSKKAMGRYKGCKRSVQVRAKLSQAQRNRTNQNRSEEARRNIAKANINRSKSVLQCDVDGNIIEEWVSRKAASEVLGIGYSGICNASLNISKTSGGYKWIIQHD